MTQHTTTTKLEQDSELGKWLLTRTVSVSRF